MRETLSICLEQIRRRRVSSARYIMQSRPRKVRRKVWIQGDVRCKGARGDNNKWRRFTAATERKITLLSIDELLYWIPYLRMVVGWRDLKVYFLFCKVTAHITKARKKWWNLHVSWMIHLLECSLLYGFLMVEYFLILTHGEISKQSWVWSKLVKA